jgi:hypothetical protein
MSSAGASRSSALAASTAAARDSHASDLFANLGAVVERGAHPIGFPLAVAGLLALARVDQESVELATAGVVVLLAWPTRAPNSPSRQCAGPGHRTVGP